jgi:IPT/TIG domain
MTYFTAHLSKCCSIGLMVVSLSCLVVSHVFSTELQAQVSVTTYHNDNARTGQNTQETSLTPANVNSSQFGKLFSVALDGYVYAQPLYMANVPNIAGGTHNVLYVATEHDSVYAIDADNGTVLWQQSFINPAQGITTVPSDDVACHDLAPEIGITSTPVIDPTTSTIYTLERTKENGSYFQRLHALDIVTHAEKFGGPVVISATFQGRTFDPLRQNSRPALLLENGHVLLAWAALCDHAPYQGWLISYSAATLAQEAVFNTETTVVDGFGGGGIWMSGDGVATDADGNLYFTTGNGEYDNSVGNYGDSIMKLSGPAGGQFSIVDWFTPFNQSSLDATDTELSSGGVLLLPDLPAGSPHQQLLVQMGKEGRMYLIDRNDMGQYCSTCESQDTQIVQEIPGALPNGVYGAPAFWNNTVYFGNDTGGLRAWSFNAGNTGLLSNTPVSQSPQPFIDAVPVISANGNSNGILWVIDNSTYLSTCCQALYAYDATNLGSMLYNSNQAAGNRDVPGGAVKFTAPLVANGKVYVGSQGAVTAYGSLSKNPAPSVISISPNSGPATGGTGVSIVGTGFLSGATVQLGGVAASNVAVVSSSSITAVAAAHSAGTVDVVVTNTDTQSGTLSVGYTYTAASVINVTASPTSVAVSAGGSAAYAISQNGNSPASLTCSVPSNVKLGCSFNPTSIAPGATSTLTVTTTAPTSALVAPPENKLPPIYALWLPLPAFAIAGIGFGSRRRSLGVCMMCFLVTALTLVSGSCGGGSSLSSGSSSSPGTPAGTYNILVTGTSGSLTGTTNVTLTVQ